MGGDWHHTTLGKVVTLQRGFDLPTSQRIGRDYPVIASTGPVGSHKEAKVSGPGVVIGRSGSIGGSQFIRGDFWPLNTTLWVKNFNGNDPRFCHYFLKSLDLAQFNAGSGVPTLNRNHIHDLPVSLPTPGVQRTISYVLGTLDDKIELNRRMNETMEAMARALFKSWFVDFDPVRAKMEGRDTGLPQGIADLFPDRFVDSEMGEIPEGWQVRSLRSFGDIVTGKTPRTRNRDFYGSDVPFLKIPDMRGKVFVVKTTTMLSRHGAESQRSKTLPSGSVSVSCIATPGLVVLNHQTTQTNQQINSIVPHDFGSRTYLYWSCRQLASEIMLSGSGGSVFQNMNKTDFGALKTIDAGDDLRHSFDETMAPIHQSILGNEKANQCLAALRDTLLPKLISGEICVPVAERALESVT